MREYVSSYTAALHVEDEKHGTLRDTLIRLCTKLGPLDGPHAVIRTDFTFKSLVNDDTLYHHRITLKLGHAKNSNKTKVGERAVQELEEELRGQEPRRGSSVTMLAIATAQLNSRIRSRGLSAKDVLPQRDQLISN